MADIRRHLMCAVFHVLLQRRLSAHICLPYLAVSVFPGPYLAAGRDRPARPAAGRYLTSPSLYFQDRIWQRGAIDRPALQPDVLFYPELLPPAGSPDNPINAVTTRFVRTATNKMRCPIFCLSWTPEGRRLITGASSGEFTLWNGLTFNFETILQVSEGPSCRLARGPAGPSSR